MRCGFAGRGYEEAMMVTDPVCKMQIDEKTAVGKSEHEGKTYYFCAVGCKKRFDENPQKYTAQ
jgi:YHS domain-containing protein